MGKVMHNVVHPPNETGKDSHVTSTSPRTKGPSQVPMPPGAKGGGSKVINSNGSLPRRASPIDPPNNTTHQFKMSDAQMGQPESVVELGKGAIPIPIGRAMGEANREIGLLRDSATRRK